MTNEEAIAAVSAQFEAVFSFTKQYDFLASIHFSQTLDRLLTLLPSEDDYEHAVSYLPIFKLVSFTIIVSKSLDTPRIIKVPRSRVVNNIVKCLETTRRLVFLSSDACRELNDQHLPRIFLSQLDYLGNYPAGWSEENICRLTRSMLDFLAEINRRIPTSRAKYRSADGVRIFLALTSSPNETIRLTATLLLCNIIGERENDFINATERHLRLVLNFLPKSRGPRRLEILQALKSLITHDRNKDFFAENHLAGLLEEFTMRNASVWTSEEEATVYEIIWILSFTSNSRKEICECSALMKTMETAAKSGRTDAIKCNAKGVLWKLETLEKKSSLLAKKENQLVTDSAIISEDGNDPEGDDESSDDEDEIFDEDDDDVVDSFHEVCSDPLKRTMDSSKLQAVTEEQSMNIQHVNLSVPVLLVYTPNSRKLFKELEGALKEADYEVISRCSLSKCKTLSNIIPLNF